MFRCYLRRTTLQTLSWHTKRKSDNYSVKALPAFRPDSEKKKKKKCIPELVDQIFKQRLSGKKATLKEADMYQTAIMLFLEKEYRKAEFVMQLHFGVIRNDSTRLY